MAEYQLENIPGWKKHYVDEAMTRAVLRTCNKCGLQVVQGDGCNKMKCSVCNNLQCFYCSKDINDSKYNHFNKSSDATRQSCPLYDEVLGRQQKEADDAKLLALQRVGVEIKIKETDQRTNVKRTVVEPMSRFDGDPTWGLEGAALTRYFEEMRRLEERFGEDWPRVREERRRFGLRC